MKQILIWGLILGFALPVVGQKKGKTDPRDTVIDSMKQASSKLTADVMYLTKEIDSHKRELGYYAQAHELLKTKVVRHDFAAAALPMVLDTMMANRTKQTQSLYAQIKSLQDDVLILQADNNRLQQALESMAQANADPDKLAHELRQLKSLLDAEIITRAEFDDKKGKLLAKWE